MFSVLEEVLVLEDILGEEVLEDSIDILDNSEVKLYRSQQSGRELFEITEDGIIFRLFPKIPFCTCQFTELIQEEGFYCAHYLATRIASALGKLEVIEKTSVEFKNILKLITL